jgi:signal transduction histidine kinase
MTGLARSWWVLPLTLVVAGGTAGANGAREGAQGDVVLPAVVLAALATSTVLFHRWPAAAIGGNGVLVAAYFALGYADGPVYLTVPLATLVVANHRVPRNWWPWSVAAVSLVAVGQVVRATTGDRDWHQTMWQVLGAAAITAAAGATGTALRARREARRDRVQRAATEERLRMAQDLHDGVGHGLALIAMHAGVALHVLDRDPGTGTGTVRQSLETIRDQSREALEQLRSEVARMSGEQAPRRPAPGVAQLAALVERVRAGGLRVDLDAAVRDLPDAVDHTAYVVVQESLTNVLRHARAASAIVTLAVLDDRLVVTVADDGDAATAAGPVTGSVTGPVTGSGTGHDGGMGIRGMRSRVEALGGTFEAGPTSDGFRVRAELPVGSP